MSAFERIGCTTEGPISGGSDRQGEALEMAGVGAADITDAAAERRELVLNCHWSVVIERQLPAFLATEPAFQQPAQEPTLMLIDGISVDALR
jgi:hypothetical protein